MFSIVEVCRTTKLSSRTLRIWEEEGILNGFRDANGVRQYRASIFEEIKKIQAFKDLGLSLKDIKSLLDGKCTHEAYEMLHARRAEIEKQAQNLLSLQRKIKNVEELVGKGGDAYPQVEIFAPSKEIVSRFCENLLQKNHFSECEIHKKFLEDELASLEPDELMAWFSTLKRIQRYAQESQIPLNFVRGYASSSLGLYLLGWTNIDPCAEGLIPHSPKAQPLHFDVPFFGMELFFEFLTELKPEMPEPGIVAFRLPVLDILKSFSEETRLDPFQFEPEEKIIGRLREGDCALIFGIDESGNWMLNRLYPELGTETLSANVLGEDLRKYAPQTKNDVFQFLSFRRKKTWPIFEKLLKGDVLTSNCKLAKFLPAQNKGFVFFREELMLAAKEATGWDWNRLSQFRRDVRDKRINDIDRSDFILACDEESLAFFDDWQKNSFHKAHLVSWWQLMSACMTCKIRNREAWERAIALWESQNETRWNDFGVVLSEVKILTPL